MRSEFKDAFKLALKQRLMPMGYTNSSDTIFVRELLPGVRGCIGYLKWGTLIAVKPFVGVHFEHVERIFEEFFKPLRVVSKSTPRYFPCPFRSLYELKEERSDDPEFRLKQDQYLRLEPNTIGQVCDRILIDVQEYGSHYIEFNSTLENAAVTMAEGRGGGIGSVAYTLPIIYWILGRTNEAKSYMATTATKGYPIGPYETYAALVTARIDSGPAPLPRDRH